MNEDVVNRIINVLSLIIMVTGLFFAYKLFYRTPIHEKLNTVIEGHDYIIDINIESNGCKDIKIIHDTACLDDFCRDEKARNKWADAVLNPKTK